MAAGDWVSKTLRIRIKTRLSAVVDHRRRCNYNFLRTDGWTSEPKPCTRTGITVPCILTKNNGSLNLRTTVSVKTPYEIPDIFVKTWQTFSITFGHILLACSFVKLIISFAKIFVSISAKFPLFTNSQIERAKVSASFYRQIQSGFPNYICILAAGGGGGGVGVDRAKPVRVIGNVPRFHGAFDGIVTGQRKTFISPAFA